MRRWILGSGMPFFGVTFNSTSGNACLEAMTLSSRERNWMSEASETPVGRTAPMSPKRASFAKWNRAFGDKEP